MNKITLNALFTLLVVSFFGCAAKKQVITSNETILENVSVPLADTLKVDNKKATLDSLKSTNIKFTTLSLKGKAKLNIDGKENDVNFNLRIKDQEKIWMSISAIIGEVARIEVTPDSIKILNRLETTYTKKPFNFIHEFTNNQIDFPVLQAVLVGNTIEKLITDLTNVSANQINYMLNGEKDGLTYKFVYNSQRKLDEANLIDTQANQSLVVKYGAFTVINGFSIPASLNLNSNTGSKSLGLRLEISSIEGNVPLEFPFTVGSRFKVIN